MRFNRLPNEIKSDVFSTLSAQHLCDVVAPVCREWRQFAYSSIYWSKVELPKGKQATTTRIKHILQHCVRIRQLIISSVRDLSNILDIPRHPSLRELKLTFCDLPADQLPELITTFPYVQKLILKECRHVTNDVTKNIVRWAYLTEFNLESPITGDENQFLDIITTNCKNLVLYSATTLTNLNDRSLSNFLTELGPQLKVLRISGLTSVTSYAYSLLNQCCQLTALALFGATNFTRADFHNITELRQVEDLTIGHSDVLFAEEFGYTSIGLSFPKVKKLVILHCANMREIDLAMLIESFPRTLRYLAVTPTDNLDSGRCYFRASMYRFQFRCEWRRFHPVGNIFVLRK